MGITFTTPTVRAGRVPWRAGCEVSQREINRYATCEACGREFTHPKYERAKAWPMCPECDPRPVPPEYNEDAEEWRYDKATGEFVAVK